MATIPKRRQVMEPRAAVSPVAAAPRSLVDLPPEPGYLAREMQRLSSVGELTGNEDFPVLQDGRAGKANVRFLLQKLRGELDEALKNIGSGGRVIGGGGRHTFERSVSRAPLAEAQTGDALLGVRDGRAVRLLVGDISSGGGGVGDMVKGVYDADDSGVVDNSELLDGELPAHYLARANHTGEQAISTVTGLQTALDAKATPADVTAAIAALVDASPAALDTLNELAAALGDDANFAATVTTALAGKQPLDADLTEIAALTTTSYGRALLELANGTALKALLTINAADIANASANGRSLITAANYSAMRTLLGLVIGTDVAAQSHVGAGGTAHANAVASGAAGFLTGADKAKLDGIAAGATAGNLSVIKQIFTASGTYTPTTGMVYAVIECVGGGAGGGSAGGTSGQVYGGGGGGAGSYARLVASAATIGASQAVTIGAGGAGGASGASNNGTAGGDTSVGTLCIGKGGAAGGFSNAGALGNGGAGGVAGTGDITVIGGPGGRGFYNAANAIVIMLPGDGGDSCLGGGARAPAYASASAVAGVAATGYGGGGSGGFANNTTSNAAGGAGKDGAAFITEYVIT